jgi:hypothetical protein
MKLKKHKPVSPGGDLVDALQAMADLSNPDALARYPEWLIRQHAESQVDREGVPRNTLLAMREHLDTAAWRHRLEEVEAELRRAYLDE